MANDSIEVTKSFRLKPFDSRRLQSLCGHLDENIQQIESRLGVIIINRGDAFQVKGTDSSVEKTINTINSLYKKTETQQHIDATDVHLMLQDVGNVKNNQQIPKVSQQDFQNAQNTINLKRAQIIPRNQKQREYINTIFNYDINFSIGAAGTGKTFLAVAAAVYALEQHRVQRIILVRPVVEAGEKLGFLPGDLAQKVDPYLRPIYDALFDTLGVEQTQKLLDNKVIELAPLAYMRGRTLDNAFIILDEAQNTTILQMKMFLTRLGLNSTAVITGDISQVDLPKGVISGLRHAAEVLKNIPTISFTYFDKKDVVRHPLVQDIIEAYEKFEKDSVYESVFQKK